MGVMATHAEFDSTGVLYISYGDVTGPNNMMEGAVWKYEPKPEKFTNITPAAPKKDDTFGYGGLSVDAAHPGTVMVSTLDRWTHGDEVYRTTDGGKTWKALFTKVVRDDAGAKYLYWHKPKDPIGRGWMGDIDIDPFNPGRVMYVTGQGIWGTEDATAADSDQPTHWKFLDSGLEETVVSGLVSPPAGPPLLSAVGDLCGFRHDDLNQPSAAGMFDNPLCGSATSIDVAWGKPESSCALGGTTRGCGEPTRSTAARPGRPSHPCPRARARARSRSPQTARLCCGRPRTDPSPIQRTGARPGPAPRGFPSRQSRILIGPRSISGRPRTV
jgi:xyloglucan-specific exo-beta-1,4-glucanase